MLTSRLALPGCAGQEKGRVRLRVEPLGSPDSGGAGLSDRKVGAHIAAVEALLGLPYIQRLAIKRRD